MPTLEDADSALPADDAAAAAATGDEELAALLHEGPAGPADDEPDADDAADPDDEGGADDAEDDAITFADLGLPPELLDAVTRMGFVTPTPIQAEAIPALLSRRDVVGIAQTGTGKTAAFGLPLLAGIDPAERDVQALVLAPTRELAMQSAQAMEDFAQRSRDVDIVAVYGGAPYG
ncbi:MAG: DEAD/DEAH box helicase, partial [Actinomyces sp.]